MKNKIEIKGDTVTLTANNGSKVVVERRNFWALGRAIRQSNILFYSGSEETETLNISEGSAC